MLDFILSHPLVSAVVAGSISAIVYRNWLNEQGHKNEIARLNKQFENEHNRLVQMIIRNHDVEEKLNNFQTQTGIDVDLLTKLADVEADIDDEIAALSRKVRKYIHRLMETNEQKKEAFRSRPVLAACATKIAKLPLFCQTTAQFLDREQELGRIAAEEKGLVCHLTTKKTRCKVLRVVDGDTFDVEVGMERVRIRAMGYDTPEVCHPKKSLGHWGIQSSFAAADLVKNGKIFHVYLDPVGYSKNWTNDRYGRTLAHLEVDGVLIGQTLVEQGHAEVVEVFPIDKSVLDSYKKAELDARLHDLGMWKDINLYKITRTPIHKQKKWNLTSLVENEHKIDMTKALMKDVLSAMLGKIFTKSKTGVVLHNENCQYVKTIKQTEDIMVGEETIESCDIRPCKRCNGDELVHEMMRQ